jgi:hypothetical protein
LQVFPELGHFYIVLNKEMIQMAVNLFDKAGPLVNQSGINLYQVGTFPEFIQCRFE